MYYIIDHSTDPYWNLAAEEYLFKNLDKPVFRLWQNDNAIIIGQHQNALAEINLDYVRKNGIKVVRRLTGGGAVYHDMGNVNFTFIDNRIDNEDTASMFARFTKPVIDSLLKLGVKAYLEGRNDLLIDGKKFSGNAVAVYRERVLQHGTLLFSSSMNTLGNALASRPEKFISKSVKSNIARVTNIGEHLEHPMTISEFMDFMEKEINTINRNLYQLYSYSDKDTEAIKKLRDEKYSQDWWNFGFSPVYQYSKVKQFPGGLVEIYLIVSKGIITDIKIFGSYFFIKDTNEIESLLTGAAHTPDGVSERLKNINLSDYFGNVEGEEFLSLFWD